MHDYEAALDAVRALAKQGKRVWIDPERVNYAFANVVSKDRCVIEKKGTSYAANSRDRTWAVNTRLSGIFPLIPILVKTVCFRSLVAKPSPVALAKGIKNERELEGMRAAHVRDGVAMVLALSQLERDVAAGLELTEVDVDERITAARAQQEKFLGKLIILGCYPPNSLCDVCVCFASVSNPSSTSGRYCELPKTCGRE